MASIATIISPPQAEYNAIQGDGCCCRRVDIDRPLRQTAIDPASWPASATNLTLARIDLGIRMLPLRA